MIKIPHFRWWVGFVLFIATGLSFFDRQVLSILAPAIMRDVDRLLGDKTTCESHHHSLSFPAWYTSDRHRPVTTAGIGETDPGLSIPNMK
jgi:hypothetical protein